MTGSRRAARGQGSDAGPVHGPRRRREGSRTRRTIGVALLALVLLLAAGAGWVYVRLGKNIPTFGADGVSRDRPRSTAGQNVLVIGSDSRAGANESLGGGTGDVGRSDTTFLLHIYPDHRHAVGVSVPRDALADIPRCRLPDGRWSAPQTGVMFNSAFTVRPTASPSPAPATPRPKTMPPR